MVVPFLSTVKFKNWRFLASKFEVSPAKTTKDKQKQSVWRSICVEKGMHYILYKPMEIIQHNKIELQYTPSFSATWSTTWETNGTGPFSPQPWILEIVKLLEEVVLNTILNKVYNITCKNSGHCSVNWCFDFLIQVQIWSSIGCTKTCLFLFSCLFLWKKKLLQTTQWCLQISTSNIVLK